MSYTHKKQPMSHLRKIYMARLVGRCLTFLFSIWLWFFHRSQFDVAVGMNFFDKFSLLHILWVIWMIDMLLQLIPVKTLISLGSQKHFRFRFHEAKEKISLDALKQYTISTARAAGKVAVLWSALIAVIAVLYYQRILDASLMVLISICFYVCDLICVLIWCPFRLLMKTRCCTTCRIFNWDHLMMFSPMLFIPGFFAQSLFWVSVAVVAVWELCILIHPERFWEKTNATLRCASCTDKLCTQYCQKLRPKH